MAISLASGATKQEAADDAGVDRTTLYNWLKFDEFSAEVDRLSLMVGIASRAERLRIAQRVVRHKAKDGMPQSDKDLLDWSSSGLWIRISGFESLPPSQPQH